jgi:DNA replication protein DnaC
MNPVDKPPGVSDADWAAYNRRLDQRAARRKAEPTLFEDLADKLAALPPETEADRAEREKAVRGLLRADRFAGFKRVCPEEFAGRIDRARLKNPAAFDAVAKWDGSFPGPLAHGPTGGSKTRAAWSALARMIIEDGKTLVWFPVSRLIEKIEAVENPDEFYRAQRRFDLLLVDDLDKINWQFESQTSTIFQFYDWVYREHRPCVTTTNKDRKWWADKMGDAFARRLFDDAHRAIAF